MIIKNGTVYDPMNGIDGEKKDLFIKEGKIVEEADGKEIDASGLIVLPGGVEIHTHIAGSKVNLGRLFRPEDHRKDPVLRTGVTRGGVGYTVPTPRCPFCLSPRRLAAAALVIMAISNN
ncbi:unnamed protein product, partial [marine sediment metagenome]